MVKKNTQIKNLEKTNLTKVTSTGGGEYVGFLGGKAASGFYKEDTGIGEKTKKGEVRVHSNGYYGKSMFSGPSYKDQKVLLPGHFYA